MVCCLFVPNKQVSDDDLFCNVLSIVLFLANVYQDITTQKKHTKMNELQLSYGCIIIIIIMVIFKCYFSGELIALS